MCFALNILFNFFLYIWNRIEWNEMELSFYLLTLYAIVYINFFKSFSLEFFLFLLIFTSFHVYTLNEAHNYKSKENKFEIYRKKKNKIKYNNNVYRFVYLKWKHPRMEHKY